MSAKDSRITFRVIFILVPFFIFNPCFAQDITPVRIERSQEILQKEEGLRQRIQEPQKVFVKEIILPQGCRIPAEEIEQMSVNFSGYLHSLKEIQELLNILSQAYQKAYSLSKLPQTTYILDQGKLRVNFEKK